MLRTGWSGVRVPTGARRYSLSQNIQTGFGAQPASNSMGSFPRIKRLRCEVDHSYIVRMLRMSGVVPPQQRVPTFMALELWWWRDISAPPNVLNNGYRLRFLGVKRLGCGTDHPPSSSAGVHKGRTITVHVAGYNLYVRNTKDLSFITPLRSQ
jgi:hypothetical protein